MLLSKICMNSPIIVTSAKTINVVCVVSFLVGQETRFTSSRDLQKKSSTFLPACPVKMIAVEMQKPPIKSTARRATGWLLYMRRIRISMAATSAAIRIFALSQLTGVVSALVLGILLNMGIERFILALGRDSRSRTYNLRFWRPMLCQLSYTPNWSPTNA